VRTFRALLADPDQTDLAYQVFDALDPEMHERTLARLLAHPEGRRVFADRPVLLAMLGDRPALEAMPEGSFGRAYLDHLDRHGLDPAKLVELDRDHRSGRALDPDLRWVGERSSLQHDLWHVLCGYGADELGEGALLAFSLAQSGGRANRLLAIGTNLRLSFACGPRWLLYAFRAWRRGKRAACLTALPYEDLLALPLADVRAAVGLNAPEVDHPGGVARGDPLPKPPV
jgi:ubiquinone biosynthesis protein COQ4